MEHQGDVLIVDDDEATRISIGRILEPIGYRVRAVATAEEGLVAMAQASFDAVLCDIRLPGMDGVEFQERVRVAYADVPVVMITAYSAVESAVRTLRSGAYDYLVKPFTGEEVRAAVRRAVESRSLRLEVGVLRETVREARGDVWCEESPVMKRLYAEARRVAQSGAAVFIDGESGTGKEILANAIHLGSPRRDRVFLAVNCAAIPESLADSQLFGHVRGAFTGAVSDQRGFLELANGGTLFLDEIPELKSEIQAKLLRVLEERRIRRLGSERTIEIDVRILAAAQKAPEELVREKKLREDLFFRIDAVRFHVPSLRERPEDIRGFALHFLRRFAREMKKPIEGITPEAVAVLERYGWPGNVRELKNVMERASIFAKAGSCVGVGEIPEKVRGGPPVSLFMAAGLPPPTLDELTRAYVEHVLKQTEGNRAQASRILDVSPTTIWRYQNKSQSSSHAP